MTALMAAPNVSGQLFADKDLIGLYRKIETTLPHQDLHIVQFISCYPGEGATTVARALATLAARTLARRTLFVDLGDSAWTEEFQDTHAGMAPTLLDAALGGASLEEAIITKTANDNASYDYARLAAPQKIDEILPNLEKFKLSLRALQDQFRLIVIATPGALIDPAAIPLGTLIDGAVLVVEAERTRSPAVKQMLGSISTTGTRLIGMVLNKRRHYIPGWLYRFL